jgi:hypothetical protein
LDLNVASNRSPKIGIMPTSVSVAVFAAIRPITFGDAPSRRGQRQEIADAGDQTNDRIVTDAQANDRHPDRRIHAVRHLL